MSTQADVDRSEPDRTTLQHELAELRLRYAQLAAQHAALREREAHLTTLLDYTPFAIYSFGPWPERPLTFLNAGVERLIGYQRERLLTTPGLIAQIVHPDDLRNVIESIERQTATPFRHALRCTHANGSPILVESLTIPILDAQGRIIGYEGIATDVTGHQHIEEQILLLNTQLEQRVRERTLDLEMSNRMLRGEIADRELVETALTEANQRLATLNVELRDSRDLLRAIFDNLDDGLLLISREGIALAANSALERFYDRHVTTIIGTPWQQHCSQTMALITQTFTSGKVQIGRVRLTTSDQRRILVDTRAFPLAKGVRPARVLLHLTDVTERVQLESLAIQNEQLAASSRLAAIVAHEVNTPLQAIQNFLFLASGSSGAQRNTFLALIGEEIDRIGALIRRLLDFHRPDDTMLKPLSLNGLVERVLLLTGSTLVKKRIAVERDLADNLQPFIGRSDHMTQVLLNLIWNAIDSMPNGGTLRLKTFRRTRRKRPALLVLELQDTGPGIPPDLQQRIFEPFFTTKAQGTGLGLAVSKQIISQHGRMIDVRSEVGVGSTFVITLTEADEATALGQP